MQANGVLRYALVRSRCEGAERHGNWLPWIKANPDFSEQTTSRIGEGVLHVVKNTMRVGAHCRDRRVGLFLCAHTRLFAY